MAVLSLQLMWYGIVSAMTSYKVNAFDEFDNSSTNHSTQLSKAQQMASNFNESIVLQRAPVNNSSVWQSENTTFTFRNFSLPGGIPSQSLWMNRSERTPQVHRNKTDTMELSTLERTSTERTISNISLTYFTPSLLLELENSTTAHLEKISQREKVDNRTVKENAFLYHSVLNESVPNNTSSLQIFKNSNNTLHTNSSVSLHSPETVRENSTKDNMLTSGITQSQLYTTETNESDTFVPSEVGTIVNSTRSAGLTSSVLTHRNHTIAVTAKPSQKPQHKNAIQTLLLQGLRHGLWKHREPMTDRPFRSLVWRDKKYLISVLVPIGVGITGSVVIVIAAFLIRLYKRREKRRAFRSPNSIFRPQAQLAVLDNVLLLDDSSDDGFLS